MIALAFSLAAAAAAAAAAEPAAHVSAATLVEHPIASGSRPVYLDGSDWIAHNQETAAAPLPGRVPGDIITDLEAAGRVKDPYWNVTWCVASLYAASTAALEPCHEQGIALTGGTQLSSLPGTAARGRIRRRSPPPRTCTRPQKRYWSSTASGWARRSR